MPVRCGSVLQGRFEPMDGLDDFPTPPWATRSVVEHVIAGLDGGGLADLRQQEVWEPACGRGHMASVLQGYFGRVMASDVADYSMLETAGPAYRGQTRVMDFTCPHSVPRRIEKAGVDWIITNPPYNLGAHFVERALDLKPRRGVAMLVRLAFLEGLKRHAGIFSVRPPAIIAQFVERVPMYRARLSGKGSTATAYCWLVWRTDIRANDTRFFWIPRSRRALELDGDYPDVTSAEFEQQQLKFQRDERRRR